MLKQLQKEIKRAGNPQKAVFMMGYFKTKEGEYGFGDVFLGLTVPQSRQIAKMYTNLPLFNIEQLLCSKMHEERLIALFILGDQFKKSDAKTKKAIFDFYLSHTNYVNNWDLVDSSAPEIVGGYLIDKPRKILAKLAKSDNVWERRIAIVATYTFIQQNDLDDTFRIAEMLLSDKHDLIHKAAGWMLREAGKKNLEKEVVFLKKHYKSMPRTMLRYAIERFPTPLRTSFMAK